MNFAAITTMLIVVTVFEIYKFVSTCSGIADTIGVLSLNIEISV